jgi:putative ABC transport system permease protein
MQILPILSAMRRNKVGAVLIALQIAVTLAILCNGLFIVQQRLALSHRPSGMVESDLFAISNEWIGDPPDVSSRVRGDVAALRALPGVVDAANTDQYPLTNSGWSESIDLEPDQQTSSAFMSLYMGDEHLIDTLGLKLVAGRNFEPSEIVDRASTDRVQPATIIVTRALADKLFPDGKAIGRSVYVEGGKHPTQIVGIVERLQIPWTGSAGWEQKYFEYSVIEPFQFVDSDSWYLVRTQPGQLTTVMQAARKRLLELDRNRLIQKIEPVTDTRVSAYRDDRGLAVILAVVCAALVGVTACGIVGLTSYWVAQRRRQIGIRRALGASRRDVVRYFQTENFLIAAAGALGGVAFAIALNLWMVRSFEMLRMDLRWPIGGAIAMLMLGQLAVLWPALRAASVPPALATRSA